MNKIKQQEAPKPAQLSQDNQSDYVVIVKIQEMNLEPVELKISSIEIFHFIFD